MSHDSSFVSGQCLCIFCAFLLRYPLNEYTKSTRRLGSLHHSNSLFPLEASKLLHAMASQTCLAMGLLTLQVLRHSGLPGKVKIFLKSFHSSHSYWGLVWLYLILNANKEFSYSPVCPVSEAELFQRFSNEGVPQEHICKEYRRAKVPEHNLPKFQFTALPLSQTADRPAPGPSSCPSLKSEATAPD